MVAVGIHMKFSTDVRLFTATVGGSRTVEALTVVTAQGCKACFSYQRLKLRCVFNDLT